MCNLSMPWFLHHSFCRRGIFTLMFWGPFWSSSSRHQWSTVNQFHRCFVIWSGWSSCSRFKEVESERCQGATGTGCHIGRVHWVLTLSTVTSVLEQMPSWIQLASNKLLVQGVSCVILFLAGNWLVGSRDPASGHEQRQKHEAWHVMAGIAWGSRGPDSELHLSLKTIVGRKFHWQSPCSSGSMFACWLWQPLLTQGTRPLWRADWNVWLLRKRFRISLDGRSRHGRCAQL